MGGVNGWAWPTLVTVQDRPDGPAYIVIVNRRWRSRWFVLTCFCRRGRKDGSCKRTDTVIAAMTPTARDRTRRIEHPKAVAGSGRGGPT